MDQQVIATRKIKIFLQKHSDVKWKTTKLEHNLGFSGGNNVGFRARDKDSLYLLLLNNDAVLFPDALDKMIDYAESHSNVAGVQGVILSQEQAFLIPSGFAHRFQALEDTYLLYMVTKEYFPQHERYIDWCDSEIG